jgi:hypothetical protein
MRNYAKLRVIENTYEGTYDLCERSKIHLLDQQPYSLGFLISMSL